MSIAGLVGKAQTVLEVIDPENLGITLPHEHLVIDGKAFYIACCEMHVWIRETPGTVNK